MGGLVLRAFRVRNFRNIDDSGWIALDRVTALVGHNEAGKTALLQALLRLNPAAPAPCDPVHDFPRERFVRDFRDPSEWPVASARFEILAPLRGELASLVHPHRPPGFVVATRYYDQRLEIAFEPAAGEPETPAAAVAAALEQLAEAMPATPEIVRKNAAPEGVRREPDRGEALRLWVMAAQQAVAEEPDLATPAARAMLERIAAEAAEMRWPETEGAVEALSGAIASALAPDAPLDVEALRRAVEPRLPLFIYIDKELSLEGALHLPSFVGAPEHGVGEAGRRTAEAVFRQAGMTADEMLELGTSESRERRLGGEVPPPDVVRRDQARARLRAIRLGSASADITRRFAEWWKQESVAIRYEAEGDFFRIWVAGQRRPAVEIELESRSQGFQWFFAFHLLFLAGTEGRSRDAVLLLDSPGVHLHPAAQRELLSLFEHMSEAAPLIYATHSPFLIDGNHLGRLRLVGRDEAGRFRVGAGIGPADRETLYPVQAAAAYAVMQRLMGEGRHLLIGELADYLYLQALNLLCRRSRRPALMEGITLTPCGGAALAAGFASLFPAAGPRPAVLLRGDAAGRAMQAALMAGSDPERCGGPGAQVMLLDDLLGRPETGAGIEDLLGELHLLAALDKVLGQHLLLMPVDRDRGGIIDHIRAAAKRLALALPADWQSEIARQTAADWAQQEPEALPDGLLDMAGDLFAAINARFGASEQKPAQPAIRLAASAAPDGPDRRYDPKVAARLALARGTE